MSVTLHTSHGPLKLELFCDKCPNTTYNFLALCGSHYYDGTKFHRSIPGFLLQGGDPTASGKGGKSVHGNPLEDEFDESLKHDTRGMVGFASNGPNGIGSQFYILYGPANHLDAKFTIFGRLSLETFETLNRIEACQVSGKKSKPVDDIVIQSVTIHANPLA